MKNLLSRINFELVSHINKLLSVVDTKKLSFPFQKFWFFIFQLESLRSTQYNKIILLKDKLDFISSEITLNVDFHKTLNYNKYLFSLQVFRMQILLRDVISQINTNFRMPVLSLDVQLEKFFLEYQRRLYFIYNSTFLNFISHKICLRKSFIFSSSIFNLNFSQKEYLFLSNQLRANDRNIMYFELFISIHYCINQFRYLGLFHKVKFRPVSNTKYVSMDDLTIIKNYIYLSTIFLNWFRCCYNIGMMKRIIYIFKESCFLTLCRKHNKHKSWVYNVYNKDLYLISSATRIINI